MSSDLRTVLHAAAASPTRPLDVERLWRRGRRRRATVSVTGLACVAVLVTAISLLITAPSRHHAASGTPQACTARDLTGVVAQWQLTGLVLNGTLAVTNSSPRACLLSDPARPLPGGLPGAQLLDPSGNAVTNNSGPGYVALDGLLPAQTLQLESGQTAAAKIGWGGSYCGPALTHVVLRWTLPDGDIVNETVRGGVLQCIDSIYYEHGQSTAGISGFFSASTR